MTMIKFYSFLMIACLWAVPVWAQDQPPGDEQHQPPSADEIVSRMQAKLSLTQDQVTAVTPIVEKYSSKREDLRQGMEDGTVDRDSMRSQVKQLKEDEKQELSQVMSADQLSQWEQMQNQGRHKHSSGGNNEGKAESSSDSGTNSEVSAGSGE